MSCVLKGPKDNHLRVTLDNSQSNTNNSGHLNILIPISYKYVVLKDNHSKQATTEN